MPFLRKRPEMEIFNQYLFLHCTGYIASISGLIDRMDEAESLLKSEYRLSFFCWRDIIDSSIEVNIDMEEFGELTGLAIIFFYGLTILNFVFKFVLKRFRPQLMKRPKFFAFYLKLVKFFVKYHRWFGITAITFALVHFMIQFFDEGLSLTGVLAAGVMFMQVGLGAFGTYAKPKSKTWLWIHRLIAVLLAVVILIHTL
jgi:hypothetical protein